MIKFWIFIVSVWIIGEFTCYIIFTGTYPAPGTYAVINGMTVFQTLFSGDLVGAAMSVPTFFTVGLPALLMWDWPMFDQAGYDLFRIIFLYPLSAGVVMGLVIVFIATIQRLFTR